MMVGIMVLFSVMAKEIVDEERNKEKIERTRLRLQGFFLIIFESFEAA